MANLTEILQILNIVKEIIVALGGMGLKLDGQVHIDDLLKLIPKS